MEDGVHYVGGIQVAGNTGKRDSAAPADVIKVKVLGNKVIPVANKRIVGYCRNILHPGKLTRKLMEEHDCLRKQCRHFVKYEDAGYWQEQKKKQQARLQQKQDKRLRKQQEAAEAEELEELRELFQSYADEAGYTMQIIRVKKSHEGIYVFYVSDYPFADGNRFPDFIASVQFFFPHRRIILRHLMDLDGRFLTREEYANLRRK